LAVPNTVRVSVNAGGTTFLEFVPSLSGGQYLRNDNCFRVGVGCNSIVALANPLPNLANGAVNGLNVVIYNVDDNAAGGASNSAPSIYAGFNIANIIGHAAAGNELTLNFAATTFSPSLGLSSPGQRFQVVGGPVSYACAPVPGGAGTLRRVTGYALAAAQPAPAAGVGDLIANNVSDCTITYAAGVQGSQGLLTLWLQLERNGETVSLFRQIHVDNTP
jgi:MSHA biogenesis protein MshO